MRGRSGLAGDEREAGRASWAERGGLGRRGVRDLGRVERESGLGPRE